MNHARIALLPPLLALAACQTEKKPLTGFDTQQPGSILLDSDGALSIWPVFALPDDPQQLFQVRLNGHDATVFDSQTGYYEDSELSLQRWTGGIDRSVGGIPPDSYVVELVDSGGRSWGQSTPLAIPSSGSNSFLSAYHQQLPTVIFTHFDGQAGSWTIDPATQDADPATDEITVTNLLGDDVIVERCLITSGSRTSCTPLGTIAPGADLPTVETVAPSSTSDHQALFIHLASDASQSYQRDLVQGTAPVGDCEIERILVHGIRPFSGSLSGVTGFAMSSCYGYSSQGH